MKIELFAFPSFPLSLRQSEKDSFEFWTQAYIEGITCYAYKKENPATAQASPVASWGDSKFIQIEPKCFQTNCARFPSTVLQSLD